MLLDVIIDPCGSCDGAGVLRFPNIVIAIMNAVTQTHIRDLGRRLRINHDKLLTLSKHPYINYLQARGIVIYRRIHGPFTILDDLKHVPSITNHDINRLRSYCTLEDDPNGQ